MAVHDEFLTTTETAVVAAGTPSGRHTSPAPRLWFVDNLRILLTSLVVLHHVAVMYSGIPAWYYVEKPTSTAAEIALTVFVMVDQAWFMGAFFLLSGYFTPSSWERKGPRAFVRDRLTRLGIPLVVFYVVLNPSLSLDSSPHASPLDAYLHGVGAGPLWFALALLVFDGCYAAARLAAAHLATARFETARLETGARPARPRDPRPPTYRSVIGFALALALVTYVWRIGIPIGFWIPIVDFPSGDYLPQYASFFVLGAVAYRRGWFRTVTGRLGLAGLGSAIAATVVFLPLALARGGVEAFVGHGTLGSLFYALWDSCFSVGMVLALLALFRRRFDAQGPVRRYLAGHVFTVYVTHAFVVTLVGHALAGLHLPTWEKVTVAAAVALPACFLLAAPIRRLPGVRRVL